MAFSDQINYGEHEKSSFGATTTFTWGDSPNLIWLIFTLYKTSILTFGRTKFEA